MNRFWIGCAFSLCLAAGLAGAGEATQAGPGHDAHGAPGNAWGTEDDAAFLFGMIEHHKGALEMARAVRSSRDKDVADWAEDILEDQREEIGLMESLVRDLGLRDPGHGADMRLEMEAMLASPASADPDVNFVAMMVPHHAGAIDMALPALVYSRDMRIVKLAGDIVESQAEEIYEFRKWLDRKGVLLGGR